MEYSENVKNIPKYLGDSGGRSTKDTQVSDKLKEYKRVKENFRQIYRNSEKFISLIRSSISFKEVLKTSRNIAEISEHIKDFKAVQSPSGSPILVQRS